LAGRGGTKGREVRTATPVPTRCWPRAMRAGRPRIRCAGSPTAAAGSNATPARPRTSTSRAVTTCGRTALRAVVPSVVPDPACGGCAPSCALRGGFPAPLPAWSVGRAMAGRTTFRTPGGNRVAERRQPCVPTSIRSGGFAAIAWRRNRWGARRPSHHRLPGAADAPLEPRARHVNRHRPAQRLPLFAPAGGDPHPSGQGGANRADLARVRPAAGQARRGRRIPVAAL